MITLIIDQNLGGESSMEITEKFQGETAREFALRMIKRNIISTILVPGTMISETEIANELGISRTPVREALIELGREKLVEILPQKGIKISLIDYALVDESRFTRMVLECAILEYICENREEIDFAKIEQNIELQEFYGKQKNNDKMWELDNEFHKELFVMSNKFQTYQLMNSMETHFDRVRALSLNEIISLKRVGEHKEILKALKAKEVSIAQELMKKHLSEYKVDKEEIFKKFPEYLIS